MRAAVESDHPAALPPTIQILSLFFSQPARAASFDAEEIARKGQEVREMTRELDLFKVDVIGIVVRSRGAAAFGTGQTEDAAQGDAEREETPRARLSACSCRVTFRAEIILQMSSSRTVTTTNRTSRCTIPMTCIRASP